MITKAVALSFCLLLASATAAAPPNIVLIYADDLGYGDIGCNGASGVATPNIDRLAREGVRFTDAHSSAATCTPSRFALLTGGYAFRQRGTGIQPGDAQLIIPPGTPTIATVLRDAGYATGVVGKWHLGLGDRPIDWNGEIRPGPQEIGFDYHFLLPATGDRTPCVYVEQGRVVDLDPADPIRVSYREPLDDSPTGKSHPDLLKQQLTHGHDGTIVNGESRIGFMSGGAKARWIDEDMADVLTHKASRFIEAHDKRPFFLYFATHDIHVPRMPHSRFVGSSGLGPRGDAIAQLDWCVGEILDVLDKHGLSQNTLVIFSSDNGPVLDDGYADEANDKVGEHKPAGPYRAGKYSSFEGGTRVPTIARWPERIAAGKETGALVGQIDLAATLAEVADASPPPSAFPDSQRQLAAWLGEDPVGRPHLIEEGGSPSLRKGPWKLIVAQQTRDGLGPWRPAKFKGGVALFNLEQDPAEQTNLAAQQPEQVASLRALLKQIVDGRGDKSPTTDDASPSL